jgi:hypothetical protein
MDAKAKWKILAAWLAKLQADLDLAVDQMPDDGDETELAWYLDHRRPPAPQGLRTRDPKPAAPTQGLRGRSITAKRMSPHDSI